MHRPVAMTPRNRSKLATLLVVKTMATPLAPEMAKSAIIINFIREAPRDIMTFMTAKEMEWPMDEIAVRNSSFGEQISCRQNKI